MDEQEEFEEFVKAVMTSFAAANGYWQPRDPNIAVAVRAVVPLVAVDILGYAQIRGISVEGLINVLRIEEPT